MEKWLNDCKECGKLVEVGHRHPECEAKRRAEYERREKANLCRVAGCHLRRVEGWATCEGHAGVEAGDDLVDSFFPSKADDAERSRLYRLFKRLR